MAATSTPPKLLVKFDASLLKVHEFIEPLAQLRAHKSIKFKQAKLKTHDLEFALHSAKNGDPAEAPATFRAILTRRCDINEGLWTRIYKMADICGGIHCCVYVIHEGHSIIDSRKDLVDFDTRLLEIKPGPVCALPVKNIQEIAGTLIRMHRDFQTIMAKMERMYENTPEAYRFFFDMCAPEQPVSDWTIQALTAMCPHITDLLFASSNPRGRTRIRNIVGQELGDLLIELLDSGSL